MAKKSTAKNVSRREAVVMLGAGTVLGAITPGRAAGAQPGSAQPQKGPHPSCKVPADVNAYTGTNSDPILASLSCCDETLNAVLVGVEQAGKQPTTLGKTHLKPLQDGLNYAKLREYCFMIWGLEEKEARMLFETLPLKLGFKPTPK
jgi:hypothetical protein